MPYFYFVLFLLFVLGVIFLPLMQRQAPGSKLAIALAAVIFLMGGLGIYSLVGAPQIVPMLEQRAQRLAELKLSITENSQAVKANAKNLPAWIALGADFMETGQYDAAANAFKQAVLLSKGDPALIMAYARALIAAADGKVSDHAKKSLEMVILQQPDNPDARYFLTVRKLQDGKTEEAMRDMKSLYRSLPDKSPLKDMIDRQIGRKN